MKTRQILFAIIVFVGLSVLIGLRYERGAAARTKVLNVPGSQALEAVLNPNGSLNLATGFQGNLDARGWQMKYTADGAPRFVRATPTSLLPPGDERWDSQFVNNLGVNGTVFAVAVSGSDVYVGGSFQLINGVAASNITRWNGSTWSALGSGVNTTVNALAVNGSDVYAGGSFTSAGGASANFVARWNGSAWSALGSGLNSNVFALAVSGSDLYVGGSFTTAGGNSASRIARWDGSSWSALGSGVSNGTSSFSPVQAIAISGSDVYAGGFFTTAGGNPASRIARWDGSAWSALGSGVNGNVLALAVSGSDLYVGGSLTTAGGNPANNIAKWDGSSWSALGSGMSYTNSFSTVGAIAISGSDVYAGGAFDTAGGSPTSNVARWNGSAWSAVGTGIGSAGNQIVRALSASGLSVYAGGFFSTAGSAVAGGIAQWNGSAWSALGSGTSNSVNSTVNAVAINGNDVYVGGSFNIAGGIAANNIARWNGSTWAVLGSGVNSTVLAIAVSGSDVYVGGSFTSAGGVSANLIARWNGSSWSALGSGMDNSVFAIAISGSDLYAGGSFTTAGGNPANNIAKWDGSTWSALGSGVNNSVRAIAISGSNVYAGGLFDTAGGNPASRIARWNGSAWSALGSGVSSSSTPSVRTLAVIGGDLYAGGSFNAAGGNAANNIAKWNGSAWSALGSGVNSSVLALNVSGSDLYAGGFFTSAGGGAANFVARWNGSNWSPLVSGTNSDVNAIATTSTDVYVGGQFSVTGVNPSHYFGRYQPCIGVISPTSQTFVASGGTGSVNVSTSGCAWSAVSNAAWITITSGASGTGNGTVNYTIAANTGFTPRTGTIAIAEQTFTVTQAAACLYRLPLTSQTFSVSGGSNTISVMTTSDCAWTATSNAAWITITGGASGSGDGTVSYTVAANPDPTQRSGTITVAGQTFKVFEAGTAPAATIIVNSTSDVIANDGACTLREAILNANGNNQSGSTDCAAGTNTDTIAFNIPGPGPHTISPTSQLPAITDPVIIDGTTQPGASCTTAGGLKIELSGASAGSAAGLFINAGNSIVRGLVINRFAGDGIRNPTNGNNIFSCNYIGTNVAGTVDLGNAVQGINLNSPNNLIGGTTSGAGNLISGNNGSGILMNDPTAIGNRVEGNLIGTDITGTLAIGNSGNGVVPAGSSCVIGGTVAGARNIISGNLGNGVQLDRDALVTGNRIEGNYIGTDITGTQDLGNSGSGILLWGVANNIVGGTTAAARNVISGNNSDGISLYIFGTTIPTGNRIEGNYIGTTAAGTGGIGNSLHGVSLSQAQNNTIGGSVPGTGNIIAFNGASATGNGGVIIFSSTTATGNAILGNSIFSNNGLGIDLAANGVTANDAGDGDTGANNLQNFPVLTSVTVNGATTTIAGTLNSTASTTFTIQFFSNPACDASGNGEGQVYLGQTTVMTDASGNVAFNPTLSVMVVNGNFITATATDANGNTSEFSQCRLSCPVITLTPPALVNGLVGASYTQALTASGGVASYSFSILTGSLPPGLNLSAAGTISGMPSVSGTSSFTARATDANGCTGTQAYSIVIGTCTYTLAPVSQSLTAAAGSGGVSVITGAGCNWTATSNAGWITLTSATSGTGNGSVSYSVTANTGATRSGTITVSGSTFTVIQAANNTTQDSDGDGIPDSVEVSEGTNILVKDNDIFASTAMGYRLFVMQQYRDFLGREGDPAGITNWTNALNASVLTRAQVIESFFNSAEFQNTGAPIVRLYFAYFLRIPDYAGLLNWMNAYRAGMPLQTISEAFAASPEFQITYGSLDNTQFVTLLYQNVLGRQPDQAGLANWVNALNNNVLTRGQVMLGFSESAEFKASSANKVFVTMMYVGMLRRAPEQGGFDNWVNYLNAGNSGLALIQGFLDAPEYHNRFLP